jgi:hypothetical protein
MSDDPHTPPTTHNQPKDSDATDKAMRQFAVRVAAGLTVGLLLTVLTGGAAAPLLGGAIGGFGLLDAIAGGTS